MSDEITLVLQVQGTDQLVKLENVIKSLGRSGLTAEQQLEQAARQTAVIERGFERLAATFTSSFAQLAQAAKSSTAELSRLDESVKPKSGKTALDQLNDKLKENEVSARRLRQELQKDYDRKLIGADGGIDERGVRTGRSSIKATDLRTMRDQGVTLSPEDKVRLKDYERHLAALEELYKRQATIDRAHVEALAMNTALERAAVVAHAQALEMNFAKVRKEYLDHAQALEMNFARDKKLHLEHVAALEMNQARERKAYLEHAQALEMNFARDRKLYLEHSQALEMDFARERKAYLEHAQAIEMNTARERKLALDHAEAIRMNTAMERAAYLERAEAYRMNEAFDAALQKKREDRISQAIAFERQSAARRYAAAQDARAFVSRGGSQEGAEQRYGSSAVELANSPARFAQLKREVEAANVATQGHTRNVLGAAAAYDTLHTGLRGAAGAMGAIWLTWGRPLAALWAGFALSAGIKASITAFAQFQNTLITVGAIAGETNASLQRIGETALELSRNSIQGPQEIVDTLRIMTQAGLSARDSISQLRTVLDFATVGEMKPEAAAQSLIGISSAFGFPVAQMNRVGDVIAKAAAISQTSIENMTSSVKVSSVVAEQYGARIEDVSAILAVLAKRNIDATSAGTALRNAYTEIYAPTDKAKRAFEAIGLSAYDATTKQMKPFLQVMAELREKAMTLDKQSQNSLFQILFGERGGKVGSALLNDVQALEEAVRKIEGASGFVDEASIKMQDSLQNKATTAVNNLKASLIEAGAAAEGPLRAALDTVGQAFADPRFVAAIKAAATAFADLVKLIVDNASLIGNVVAVAFGMKLVGALTSVVSSARAAATSAGLLGGTLAAAAEGAGSVVGKLGAFESAFVGVMGALGRFLGPLGIVVAGIELASFAWDKYKTAKDKALSEQPKQVEDEAKLAAEILKRDKARLAEAEGSSELRRLNRGPIKYDEELNVFERRVRDAKQEFDRVEMMFNDRRLRAGQPLSGPDYDMALQDLKKRTGERYGMAVAELEDYKKLREELNRQNAANKLGQELSNALPTGALSKKFDEVTGRGGRNRYTDALAARQTSERAMDSGRFEDLRKGFELEQRYYDEFRRANLIGEEQYTASMESLEIRRTEAFEREAQVAKSRLFGQFLENIEKINSKNMPAAEAAGQRAAAATEFMRYYQDATLKLEQAQEAAEFARGRGEIRGRGRNVKFDGEQAGRVSENARYLESLGMKGRINEVRDGLAVMSEIELDALVRRTGIEKYFAEKRVEIQKQYALPTQAQMLQDALAQQKSYEEEALRMSEEYTRRKAEARRDPRLGLETANIRMLDEVTNLSKQVGDAWTRSMDGATEATVKFLTTGKGGFRAFADSVIQDLMRIAIKQTLVKPLLEMAGGLFSRGAGYSAAGGGGVADNAAAFGLMHSGGLVGSATRTKSADPSMFIGARRYHSGGLVLGADEVPIIAQKGERVLTQRQNREWERGRVSGPNVNVTQHIQVAGGVSRADLMNGMHAAKEAAKAEIADKMRRNK